VSSFGLVVSSSRPPYHLAQIQLLALLTAALKASGDARMFSELRDLFYKRGISAMALRQVGKDFPDEEVTDLVAQYLETAQLDDAFVPRDEQLERLQREMTTLTAEINRLKAAPPPVASPYDRNPDATCRHRC